MRKSRNAATSRSLCSELATRSLSEKAPSMYQFPEGRGRAVAVVGAAAMAMSLSAAVVSLPAHAAPLSGTITVTSPANAKIAADTAKQVIVLTVSGTGAPTLSEDTVTGVDLGADADCQDIDTYVVSSPTTISVKTPAGCAASSGGLAESVSIDIGADALTKTSAITFVNPPALAAVGDNPVIADNSVSLAPANQVKVFNTNGGQYARVVADAAFAFDPRTSSALSVSMGGKVGTELKVYADATSSTPLANTASGSVGNSLTFKTPAGMSTSDTAVTISQNGVAKTFLPAATGVSVVAAPIITSLSVTTGKAGAATSVTIKGANFNKTSGDYAVAGATQVKFCGVSATTYASPAVNTAGTEIYVSTPTAVTTMLGVGKYAGPCDVQVTGSTPTAANTSPITKDTVFTFVKE